MEGCRLAVNNLIAADGNLFGLNTIFGPIVTLPYNDPGLLASAGVLGAGTLRWPGGTVANYWSLADGGFHWQTQPGGSWEGHFATRQARVELKPAGTFTPWNFWSGVASASAGATPTGPIWVLNVLTMQGDEMLAQIDALQASGAPVGMIEIGNELSYGGVYLREFPYDGMSYAAKIRPLCAKIRQAYPDAKIGVVSGGGEWMGALAEIAELFDAIVWHDYSPDRCLGVSATEDDRSDATWMSYVAAYGDRTGDVNANSLNGLPTALHNKHWWLTEFALPKNRCGAPFPELGLGTLRGAHWLSHVLSAINGYDGAKAVRLLAYQVYTNQWNAAEDARSSVVSLPSGSGEPGYPDEPRLGGMGQIFAHVAAVALRGTGTLMAGTSSEGGCGTMPNPAYATAEEREEHQIDCLQAAGFTSSSAASFVVINRCHHAVDAQLSWEPLAQQLDAGEKSERLLTTTAYAVADPGAWRNISEIDVTSHPWLGGPLTPLVNTRVLGEAELAATEIRVPGLSITIATLSEPPTPPVSDPPTQAADAEPSPADAEPSPADAEPPPPPPPHPANAANAGVSTCPGVVIGDGEHLRAGWSGLYCWWLDRVRLEAEDRSCTSFSQRAPGQQHEHGFNACREHETLADRCAIDHTVSFSCPPAPPPPSSPPDRPPPPASPPGSPSAPPPELPPASPPSVPRPPMPPPFPPVWPSSPMLPPSPPQPLPPWWAPWLWLPPPPSPPRPLSPPPLSPPPLPPAMKWPPPPPPLPIQPMPDLSECTSRILITMEHLISTDAPLNCWWLDRQNLELSGSGCDDFVQRDFAADDVFYVCRPRTTVNVPIRCERELDSRFECALPPLPSWPPLPPVPPLPELPPPAGPSPEMAPPLPPAALPPELLSPSATPPNLQPASPQTRPPPPLPSARLPPPCPSRPPPPPRLSLPPQLPSPSQPPDPAFPRPVPTPSAPMPRQPLPPGSFGGPSPPPCLSISSPVLPPPQGPTPGRSPPALLPMPPLLPPPRRPPPPATPLSAAQPLGPPAPPSTAFPNNTTPPSSLEESTGSFVEAASTTDTSHVVSITIGVSVAAVVCLASCLCWLRKSLGKFERRALLAANRPSPRAHRGAHSVAVSRVAMAVMAEPVADAQLSI